MKTYNADPELTALLKEAAEAGKPLRVRADDSTYEVDVRGPATKASGMITIPRQRD